jgi:hypothetical protein
VYSADLKQLLRGIPDNAKLIKCNDVSLVFEYKLISTYYVVDLISGIVSKHNMKIYGA